MNAISQTIKAAQDMEAARKASEAAARALQLEIYADARARVTGLLDQFNAMPMELRGTYNRENVCTEQPLYSAHHTNHVYAACGKGLRFFLVWAADGQTLVLILNAKCRFAGSFARKDINGRTDPQHYLELRASTDLMSLLEARRAVAEQGQLSDTCRDVRLVGHITIDGRFAIGKVPHDAVERSEFISPTPAAWMTRIVTQPDITTFVVVPPEGKLAKKAKK